MLATFIMWCVAVLVVEAFRIWSALNGPPDLDEYANHLDFQLIASVFLLVTRWLPLLAVLLLLELGVFSLISVIQRLSRHSGS